MFISDIFTTKISSEFYKNQIFIDLKNIKQVVFTPVF